MELLPKTVTMRAVRVPRGTTELWIAPVGDIQWTGRREDIAYGALKAYLARARERGAWYVGVGDYLDFASPSNRQRLRAAALYDTAEAVVADKARELTQQLYRELLAPTRGRWLGMVSGHHYAMLETGETSDMFLAQQLAAPFLGTAAAIGVSFATSAGTRTISLMVHHGVGGGQTDYAGLAKLAAWAKGWERVDIFLMGHTTRLGALPVARAYPIWQGRRPSLGHREVRYVNCGGWMRAYREGARVGRVPHGSYAEAGMLSPLPLSAPMIHIECRVSGQERGLDSSGCPTRQFRPRVRAEV